MLIHRRKEGERYKFGLNVSTKKECPNTQLHIEICLPVWVTLLDHDYVDFASNKRWHGKRVLCIRFGFRYRVKAFAPERLLWRRGMWWAVFGKQSKIESPWEEE